MTLFVLGIAQQEEGKDEEGGSQLLVVSDGINKMELRLNFLQLRKLREQIEEGERRESLTGCRVQLFDSDVRIYEHHEEEKVIPKVRLVTRNIALRKNQPSEEKIEEMLANKDEFLEINEEEKILLILDRILHEQMKVSFPS